MRDNTEIGRKIKQYLAGELEMSRYEPHMLFYQQRRKIKEEIEHLLRIGGVVILDRFSASAIAYGVAGNLSMSYCKAFEDIFSKPDITLYLDVTINDVFHRGGFE